MNKSIILTLTLFLAYVAVVEAQVAAGVTKFSSSTMMTVGSDPDQKMFGEGRLSTGSHVGLEGTFGYNFIRRDEVNFYSGFHLGIKRPNDNLYLGVPLGLLVKPFPSSRNLGIVMEASPIFHPNDGDGYFRAGIGLKYTFR